MATPYEQAQEFHDKFHPCEYKEPTPFSSQDAGFRAGFKVEELVEFLYAASNNQEDDFKTSIENLKASIDQAVVKITIKNKKVEDPLVEEIDALLDTLYFTYGSFVLMGVDPTDMFNRVHEANMGKLFPDGLPHFHPVTGKVLKPENWEDEFAPEPHINKELTRQRQIKRHD